MRISIRIMILYVGFGIFPIAFGAWGWIGAAVCFWFFYALHPDNVQEAVEDDTSPRWEKVERARRGREVDPTRPDEHPLLLTHEARRHMP